MKSCSTLFDSVDCNLPGSSIHGILQARILEQFAISFSRESSQTSDQTGSSALQADALPSEPPGKALEASEYFNNKQGGAMLPTRGQSSAFRS